MTESAADCTHHARVMLAQARHFRQRAHRLSWDLGWPAKLLTLAANARRRAQALPRQGALL